MIRQLTTLSMLALVAGCMQQEVKPIKPAIDSSRNPEILSPDLYPNGSKPEDNANVRYGRYTLVNTAPENEQRDLMAQIIDVNIPGNMHPQVHDAMQYVVDRSGYSLCPDSTEHVSILYTRPLPAAQYKLGPMTLRNTLQVLAGPAWQVKVNEVTRQVCFVLRAGYQVPDYPKPPPPQTTPIAVNAPKATDHDVSSVAVVSVPPTTAAVTVAATTVQPPITSATPVAVAASKLPASPAKQSPQEHLPSAVAKDRPSPLASANVTQPAATTRPAPAAAVVSQPATRTPAIESARLAQNAAPVVVQPAQPQEAPAETWDAAVGSTLRQTVEAWAKKADWQLIWAQPDLDYPIEAALHFRGSFAEAISQIFPLYDGARRSFAVDGNTSQRIVHVSERKKL
ncbi:TcpQ domain-containing protein [Pseudomonas sp. NPDC088368]|uniref:PFGI-1 class ICE element type IV pilus protein PilL2 n=1 Tax=Pseudomonas sp. NPDC088368 TaxID=3364453 RepID=UPI003829A001